MVTGRGEESGARPATALLELPRLGDMIAGRFLVEGVAGRGGMGAVLRALDVTTGAPAAVKVIARPHLDGDERFAREARVLAELSHPAIVRYVAHGRTETGAPFLAMEWLEGEDLACLLAREQLSVSESFALIRRVCEGVAAAHERAVVHRDLKPSNLFLLAGDVLQAKVVDFGVARFQSHEAQTLTRAGTVLGTVGYMAPEQAMGLSDIDARADVFSIGCVLYECLTGVAAFHGAHDVAVLAKVLRDEPQLVSELRPELGTSLDALLARLLAKEPDLRPRDARVLLRELDQVALPAIDASSGRRPAPRHLTDSERKIVSVILARTHESAATLAAHEARQQAAQLDAFAQRFEAEPLPLRGGGLLLALSSRGAATDQACRAAHCALALRRMRPELTVAVATGGVEIDGPMPTGEAIDRAAELLDPCAPPFAVALDELTHGLLDERFDVRRAGDGLLLHGELGDVEAPRLLMGRATPCVGREKELALLEATLDECRDDAVARVVLVTSPPGVGKSRLGRALLERVRAREGTRVIVARADQMVAGSARALLSRLLRSAAGLGTGDDELTRRERLRAYLSSLLAEDVREVASEFLAELSDRDPNATPGPLLRAARNDPEVMHEQTRRAFEAFLAAESALAPVLILLEDLHWGDASSVGYLESALRHLAHRPILLVALGRPELRDTFPSLLKLDGAQELRLGGLTRRAAERLVRAVLPHDDAAVARIVEQADGNAFYLEELIRCVVERGSELPQTVLAMAQSRLERLELEARRVLRAASVFGGTCFHGGVAALLGSSLDAEAWLEALSDREILVRRRDPRFAGEKEYEFRHMLLRDAAYTMLTDDDRRVAHGLAGSWLEQVGERDARLLADHFERGGVDDRAVAWLTSAAMSGLEAGDFAGAVELAQRGLSLGARGEQRGTLRLLQGYVAALRGRPETESLTEAITLLPQASPYWWLAVSALTFGAMSLGRRDDALRAVQLAMTTPPGAELSGAYGAALQAMAAGMVIAGRTEWGWSVLERYDDVTPEDARCDPLFIAWLDLARCQLATASPYRGRWMLQRALGWGEAAADAMRAIGSSLGQATALFYLGYVRRVLGLYDRAEQALSESIEHAAHSGSVLIESYSKLILTWVKLHRGAHDEAATILDGLASSADPSVVHGALSVRAELCHARGEYALARSVAEMAIGGPSAPYRRVAYSTLARTQLLAGEAQQVLETVERALADAAVATAEYEVDLLASKAEALWSLGRAEQAAATLERAVALIDGVLTGIDDPALRAAFLGQIEANARVMALRSR